MKRDFLLKVGLWLCALFFSIGFLNVFVSDDTIPNGIIEAKSYFSIVAGLSFVIYYIVWNVVTYNRFQISLNLIDVTLLSFVLYVFLSTLIRHLPFDDKHYYLVVASGIYLLSKHLFASDDKGIGVKFLTITIFLIIGIILGIKGLMQIWVTPSVYSSFAVTGYFANPGVYGIFMAVVFTFSLGIYILSIDSKLLKILSAINVLIVLLVLPSTQSRTAWISALVGLLFVFYNYPIIKLRVAKYKSVILSLTAISLVFVPTLYKFKEASAFGRSLIWKISLEMAKDAPLIGVGFNQFPFRFPEYQYNYFKYGHPTEMEILTNDSTIYVFNDPLQILVENGIIGFALLTLALIALVVSFNKCKDPIYQSAYAGAVSIGMASLFSYPFETVSISLCLTFFLGLISSHVKANWSFTVSRLKVYPLALLLVSISIFGIYSQVFQYYTKRTLLRADDELQAFYYPEALMLYKNVLQRNPTDIQGMLGYGKCLSLMKRYAESEQVLFEASKSISDPFLSINLAEAYLYQNKFDDAEKEYDRAIHMLPNRVYPRYLLLKMLVQKKDYSKAKKIAHYISSMRIKVKSQATTDMLDETNEILTQLNKPL